MNDKLTVAEVLAERVETLLASGNSGEALAILQGGIQAHPDDMALWRLAAACASHLNDDVLAVEAYNRLGTLLDARHQYADAASAYREALVRAPHDAAVLTNFGLLLEHRGELAAAEQIQHEALRLNPSLASAHANLAGIHARQGRCDAAEREYAQAIQIDPGLMSARNNLGILLTDCNRFAEAEAVLREALAIEPDHVAAQTALAQLLLCQGRLEEGFRCFEARRTVAEFSAWFAADPARAVCRYWQGESVAGKAVLVLPEQGFGDEIQFTRYLSWLKAQGAVQVTRVCRDEQVTLLRSAAGADLVIGLTEARSHREHYDYWTLLMSLPCVARTRLDSVPAAIPYLHADPALLASWAPRLPPAGPLRVGIVWQGNPAHSNDVARSLAGPQVLAPVWQVPGIAFVGLHKGTTALPPGLPGVEAGLAIRDFADTAAILAQLDLLITVDTAAAHLAGALAIPCWVFLSACKTDWRWMRERTDSPWYPGMRLFRQSVPGDWTSPVAAVAAALAMYAANRTLPEGA